MGVSAAQQTDFGLRTVGELPRAAVPVGGPPATAPAPAPLARMSMAGGFRISAAASIGARFGRVTSTIRSAEHNRRVGGVRNSWHLFGRAMDIARAPGISHSMIAAELRRAGFHLMESLDEGDHSHFAFSDGPVRLRPHSQAEQLAELRQEANYFRFAVAPQTRARPQGGSGVTSSFR
jgi:hypothetical protein